ncbi:MAG: autotransporter outer membrane beta-barrel domain-containing protein [Thiohalomonadales bacterium]
MRTVFFITLMLVLPILFFSTSANASHPPTQINCEGLDNIDTVTCDGITISELRDMVGDLDAVKKCATEIQPGQSCEAGRLTCERVGNNGASCAIQGVPESVFNISCPIINDTTASCTLTNEIKALSAELTKVDGVISALLSPPQLAFASTLVSVCSRNFEISDVLQADCDVMLGLIANDDANAAEILDAITPDAASAAIDASQTSLRAQNRNVAQRINILRRGAESEKLAYNGLQYRSNGQILQLADFYPGLEQATGGAASADPTTKGRLGVFINGTVDMGDKDSTENERGFSYNGSEITTGVDYVLGSAGFMGVAFGFSDSSSEINDARGQLDNSTYSLILYGSFMATANTYIDANLVVGGSRFEQQRKMVYSYSKTDGSTVNVDQTASAKYFGDQFSLSLTAGHEFYVGGFGMSPYGTIQQLRSNTDSYNEQVSDPTGAGAGYALQLDGQEYQSLTLAIGGQFTYAISMQGGVFIPQARIEWITEFEDDINVVSGNYIGDPQKEKFRLPTDATDDSYAQLGLGFSGVFPGGTTYYLYYQSYLGFENLTQSSVNAGFRWEL